MCSRCFMRAVWTRPAHIINVKRLSRRARGKVAETAEWTLQVCHVEVRSGVRVVLGSQVTSSKSRVLGRQHGHVLLAWEHPHQQTSSWLRQIAVLGFDPLSTLLIMLHGQVDELAAAHRQHVAEARALQEGRALLGELAAAAPDLAAAEHAGAAALAGEAAQEYVHSACRHLYFQRAEAQLLLRKLLFCAAELHSERLFTVIPDPQPHTPSQCQVLACKQPSHDAPCRPMLICFWLAADGDCGISTDLQSQIWSIWF